MEGREEKRRRKQEEGKQGLAICLGIAKFQNPGRRKDTRTVALRGCQCACGGLDLVENRDLCTTQLRHRGSQGQGGMFGTDALFRELDSSREASCSQRY